MSNYILRIFESHSVCPKCGELIRSTPDEVFGKHFICVNCATTYYCTSPGFTEHEYLTSDNYSEALMHLADE